MGTVAEAPARDALDRALARSDAYRLLAAGFRDPDGPQAAELEAEALASAIESLAIALSETERRGLARAAGRAERAREHRLLFGHTVAHGCPPYETEYGRRHIFGQAQELGDISGFYEAFGLTGVHGGERADHVACELEFLAIVALKEAYALARGDETMAEVCRVAAAAFMRDHLGRWAPAFAGLIQQRAPACGYAALAALAARVVAGHAAELAVAPERLGPADLRPVEEEPDGLDFACGVDEADPAIPR
ncbi:MAG: hypothetical protein A2X23_13875 [Chloroflexi bacterium GWC2_73_18]|nr:MAG: hypothetical protein A2X23_13875 [Chloroflexi bacterium GWC2_73_18]